MTDDRATPVAAGVALHTEVMHADAVGTPVVLVHGVNGSAEDWREVATQLSDRPVVLVDLPGHGRSPRTGPFDLATHAAAVRDAVETLGLADVHLVGTSFGASVVVAIAAQHPAWVRSVQVLGGALRVENPPDIASGIEVMRAIGPAEFFAHTFREFDFSPGADETIILATAARAADGRSVELIGEVTSAAFEADVRALAAQVCVPAQVACGEADLTCPPVAGEQFAQALGAPFVVLPGTAHLAHVESPQAVASLVGAFLGRNDPPAR